MDSIEAQLKALDLSNPEDRLLVVKCAKEMDHDEMVCVREQIKAAIPGVKVLITSPNVDLSIYSLREDFKL